MLRTRKNNKKNSHLLGTRFDSMWRKWAPKYSENHPINKIKHSRKKHHLSTTNNSISLMQHTFQHCQQTRENHKIKSILDNSTPLKSYIIAIGGQIEVKKINKISKSSRKNLNGQALQSGGKSGLEFKKIYKVIRLFRNSRVSSIGMWSSREGMIWDKKSSACNSSTKWKISSKMQILNFSSNPTKS